MERGQAIIFCQGSLTPELLSYQLCPDPSPLPKVIRSTSLLLQRLMVQCWDANPLYRPNMKEILHQIKREEFHCLRTEVGIKGLTATSTACVFRVEPDNPPFIPPTPPQSLNHSNASTLSGSHLKPNISFNKQASIRSRPEEKRTRVTFTPVKGPTTENLPLQDCDSQPVCSEDLTSAMEYSTFRKPHTQVWVCGREFDLPSLSDTEDRKGTYTILTFYDGELGYSVSCGLPGAQWTIMYCVSVCVSYASCTMGPLRNTLRSQQCATPTNTCG